MYAYYTLQLIALDSHKKFTVDGGDRISNKSNNHLISLPVKIPLTSSPPDQP